MKLLVLLASAGVLAAALAAQDTSPTLPSDLNSNLNNLSTAKSLTVHFTKRIVGEAPVEYTLEMSKDKKFKLTYPEGFVLSDGTNVYTYTKKSNSYTQAEGNPKSLNKVLKRPDLIAWEAFFQTKPGIDILGATAGADRTVKSAQVKTFDVVYKPEKQLVTFFIDPTTELTQGYTYKFKDKDYLVLADKVELGTKDPLPDKEFAFVAPDGSKLAKEVTSDFASIQGLMNDNCMPCHSADHKRAGVDLTTYDGIAAIVKPKDSANSLLVKAVKGDGVDLMPKQHAPLTDDQISAIAAWIDAGAKNE